jgi:hypothetical protein
MLRSKALLSTLILLAIGLHVVPMLHAGERKRLWPFLVWAMYKNSRPGGPVETNVRHLVGVTSDGQRVDVDDGTVGLGYPAIERMYIRPMLDGDSASAQRLAARLNRWRAEEPLAEIRIESERYTVTDSGIVRRANPVVAYRVDPSVRDEGPRP